MRAMLFAPLPLIGCICDAPPPTEVDANFVSTHFNSAAPDFAAECVEICATENFGAASPADVKSVESCRYDALDAGVGVAVISCTYLRYYTCGGRRPAEWVRADVQARDAVGAWLAEAAELEAASVPAFEILARELAAHDAPAAFVERALASSDDERRHAHTMTSLALAHGAKPGPVRVIAQPPRDMEAIARENAIEGLVREAYGARVAIDPAIGADEHRHAALAADVHAWIRPRLPYAARLRVDEARDAARAALIAECAVELPRAVRYALGLPDATRAVALAQLV